MADHTIDDALLDQVRVGVRKILARSPSFRDLGKEKQLSVYQDQLNNQYQEESKEEESKESLAEQIRKGNIQLSEDDLQWLDSLIKEQNSGSKKPY